MKRKILAAIAISLANHSPSDTIASSQSADITDRMDASAVKAGHAGREEMNAGYTRCQCGRPTER